MRKSIRGKKAATSNKGQEKEGDEEPPPSLINAEEVDAEKLMNANTAPGGQEVEEVDNYLEVAEEKEGSKTANIKGKKSIKIRKHLACDLSSMDAFIDFALCFFIFLAESKERRELAGPEAKRARSASPCEPEDFILPPYKPNNPLGEAHATGTSDLV